MNLKIRITFLFVTMMTMFLGVVLLFVVSHQNLLDDFASLVQSIGNEQNMAEASYEEIYSKASVQLAKQQNRGAIQMVSAVGFILFCFILGFLSMNQHVLRRLNRLSDFVANSPGYLNSERRLVLGGKDEISAIAKILNDALDAGQAEKSKFEGRLVQERKAVLSLLQASDKKMALFRLNGELFGSNLSSDDEEKIKNLVKEKHTSLVGTKDIPANVLVTGADGIEVECSLIGPCEGSFIFIKCIVLN